MRRVLFIVFLGTGTLQAQSMFHDDFHQKGNFDETNLAFCQNDAYHIYAPAGRLTYADQALITDGWVEVKTEFFGGEDNRGYGLMLRAKDYDHYYAFLITQTGYFTLGGEFADKWFDITDWIKSPAIRKEGVNYLAARLEKNNIQLFINGQKVKEIMNTRFSGGFAGLDAGKEVHAHFDDIKIYDLKNPPSFQYTYEPEAKNTEFDYTSSSGAFFLDNFTDRSLGWSESANAYFENGFYMLCDPEQGRYSWNGVGRSDYEFEANMKVPHWTKDGKAGIIFRSTKDDRYGFYLNADQKFLLERTVDGSTATVILPTSVKFDRDSLLTLKVACRGPDFTLYLNGDRLADYKESGEDLSDNYDLGFYVSKDVRANFYSVRVSELPFSITSMIYSIITSVWFYLISGSVALFVLRSLRMSRKGRQTQDTQRRQEIIGLIRDQQGALRLGDVMFKYKFSKASATTMMESVCKEFGGLPSVDSDGGILYEFPDFTPSDEDIERRIVRFAASQKGRITATETANYLSMDVVESELLLDRMLDGRRVVKKIEKGVTYYEFPEITKR